ASSPSQLRTRKAARSLGGCSTATLKISVQLCQRSGCIHVFSTKRGEQPGARRGPVSRHGVDVNLEDVRDLFHRQTSEITHLHNLGFPMIKRREFFQCLVEGEQLSCAGLCHRGAFVQRYPDRASAAFQRVP